MSRSARISGAVLAFSVVLVMPVRSHAQSVAVQGYGGLSITPRAGSAPDVGGNISVQLTPAVQLVAEGGRIASVLPPVASSVFFAGNTGVYASATYAQGGVRLLAAPRAVITPYAEASAGIARLNVGSTRLGGIPAAITTAAVTLLGRNAPALGAGAGVLVRTGPIVMDLGYRYLRLSPDPVLAAALGFGQRLGSQQLRAGIGVRF